MGSPFPTKQLYGMTLQVFQAAGYLGMDQTYPASCAGDEQPIFMLTGSQTNNFRDAELEKHEANPGLCQCVHWLPQVCASE